MTPSIVEDVDVLHTKISSKQSAGSVTFRISFLRYSLFVFLTKAQENIRTLAGFFYEFTICKKYKIYFINVDTLGSRSIIVIRSHKHPARSHTFVFQLNASTWQIAYPFHVSLAKRVDRYEESYSKTSVNTLSMHFIFSVLILRHIFLHMCVIQISLKFHQHCYETRVAW